MKPLIPPLLGLSILIASSLTTAASTEIEFDISGRIGAELRLFNQNGRYEGQNYKANVSMFVEPAFTWQWNNGYDAAVITPFFRVDQQDSKRSHVDLREGYWLHVADTWELKLGVAQVFWGVTEFQHLSDVINQTDFVEDIDGEDKLGQPLLKLSLVSDMGIFDVYILPGFREQTSAGSHGRFRLPIVLDNDDATYESSQKDKHVDVVLRWSHSTGPFDLGAYVFKGTNREAVLNSQLEGSELKLVPYYTQMTQVGGDLQYTSGNWLWKAEGIWRDTKEHTLRATQTGFEYTFYGIANSAIDMGMLAEYSWDSDGEKSSRLFQNDLSIGVRFGMNDVQSTEVLMGLTYDLDYHSTSFGLEASRRLGNSWKLSLDARIFNANDKEDPLYTIDDDNYIGLTLERYF
ncbi:hypothetical protein [Neptunomonas sp.]|uniref:hypothetical protein n=1 Tax=Neptunomonas TaxID=75687 RepID=UPI0035127C37